MKKAWLILVVLGIGLTSAILNKSPKTDPHFLDEQFSEIADYIPYKDSINPKVSKVDAAWHLAHSLKTINVICQALEASDPKKFKSNFNLSRTLIYAWGDFPRGVAESPKVARPPEDIDEEYLNQQIKLAKKNLRDIQNLDPKAHFKHPYFNVIDKKQSMRFLKIHTGHHLKIVRDIIKNPPKQ